MRAKTKVLWSCFIKVLVQYRTYSPWGRKNQASDINNNELRKIKIINIFQSERPRNKLLKPKKIIKPNINSR